MKEYGILIDFIKLLRKENLLNLEKGNLIIDQLTEYISSVDLPFSKMIKSKEFVKLILSEIQLNNKTLSDELDYLSFKHKSLFEKLLDTPEDSVEYVSLKNEHEVVSRKLAVCMINFAEVIENAKTYTPEKVEEVMNKLYLNFDEAKKESRDLKNQIIQSRNRAAFEIVGITVIVATLIEFLTSQFEKYFITESFHFIFVACITTFVVLFVDPKIKKGEIKKVSRAFDNHILHLEKIRNTFEKEIKEFQQTTGIEAKTFFSMIQEFLTRKNGS